MMSEQNDKLQGEREQVWQDTRHKLLCLWEALKSKGNDRSARLDGMSAARIVEDALALLDTPPTVLDAADPVDWQSKCADYLADILDAKEVMLASGVEQNDFPTMFKQFTKLKDPSTAQAAEAALRKAADLFYQRGMLVSTEDARAMILALIPTEAAQVEQQSAQQAISYAGNSLYEQGRENEAWAFLNLWLNKPDRLSSHFPDFDAIEAAQERDAKDAELLAALQQAHMALIGYLPSHRNAVTNAAIEACAAAIASANREGK